MSIISVFPKLFCCHNKILFVIAMDYILKKNQIKWESFIEKTKKIFDAHFYQEQLKLCRVIKVIGSKVFVAVPSPYTEKILLEQGIEPTQIIPNHEVVFQFESAIIPEEVPQKRTPGLFTFENLIEGNFNKDVVKVAKEVLKKETWGPIFIYSEPGLGKTHILKAIQNEGEKIGKKVRYIDANDFGSLISEKFAEKNSAQIEVLKKSFEASDAVLFDDIQLLACRDKTNEILFQIFCKAIDNQKQILFSSDQHPEELNGFEKRLKSRFLNGLTLEIHYPEYETTVKIVQAKFDRLFPKEISVSPKIIEFIAKNKTFNRDIRKIEGVVKQLAFNVSKIKNPQLEFEDFEEIFSDQKWLFKNEISPNKIKKVISKFYQVSSTAMVSGSRKSSVVKARSVAMFLMRKLTDLSFVQIANQFNTKNHTTALNAIKKIKAQLKKSHELKREIIHLEKKIKE